MHGDELLAPTKGFTVDQTGTITEWAVVYPSGKIVSHGEDEDSARSSARELDRLGIFAMAVRREVSPWAAADELTDDRLRVALDGARP